MNLDRFDGYPNGETTKAPLTVFERWQNVGYDPADMVEPAFVLTEANYHSPEASLRFMGASQFKAFTKCPAAAFAGVQGDWIQESTVSLLVGSYVDAHFSCTLDAFRAQHPEIFRRDGGLKSEYVQADDIIQRVESDATMMQYLSGDTQRIMTGTIAGVLFKIKPDFLPGGAIVDLKIMRDFEPIWSADEGHRVHFIEAWGYDIQGAIYQEIYRQVTGEMLPFIIAAATKEAVPDIGLFEVPQARLDYCLDLVTHLAPEFSEVKLGLKKPDRCCHCDYCKLTKRLEGPVPYDSATLSA